MKIHKEARKAAKTLFTGALAMAASMRKKCKSCESRREKKPRHFLEILHAYHRSVRLELEKRSALVESATDLDKEMRDTLRRTLRGKYGKDLAIEFQTKPRADRRSADQDRQRRPRQHDPGAPPNPRKRTPPRLKRHEQYS
jgi:hypothetical protein